MDSTLTNFYKTDDFDRHVETNDVYEPTDYLGQSTKVPSTSGEDTTGTDTDIHDYTSILHRVCTNSTNTWCPLGCNNIQGKTNPGLTPDVTPTPHEVNKDTHEPGPWSYNNKALTETFVSKDSEKLGTIKKSQPIDIQGKTDYRLNKAQIDHINDSLDAITTIVSSLRIGLSSNKDDRLTIRGTKDTKLGEKRTMTKLLETRDQLSQLKDDIRREVRLRADLVTQVNAQQNEIEWLEEERQNNRDELYDLREQLRRSLR